METFCCDFIESLKLSVGSVENLWESGVEPVSISTVSYIILRDLKQATLDFEDAVIVV